MRCSRLAVALLYAAMPVSAQTETETAKHTPLPGYLKNLTLGSFGYSSAAQIQGYEFAPTSTSLFYNLNQFQCPLCISGPPLTRTRAILPPFGAKATYGLWHDRLKLSAGFGGIDAIVTDNTVRMNPLLFRATSFNDNWIVSSDLGASIAIDPDKKLTVGVTRSYVYAFGPGKQHWTQTSANLSFSPGLFLEVAHEVRRMQRRLQKTY